MPQNLLNFREIAVNPADGPVSVILNGNVDTTIVGRGAWFPDNANQSALDRVINAGEAFVVEMTSVQSGSLRRLAWSFAAAPVTSQVRHLFVRLKVAQASGAGAVLTFDYEIDLPQGHKRWELVDGVTLRP